MQLFLVIYGHTPTGKVFYTREEGQDEQSVLQKFNHDNKDYDYEVIAIRSMKHSSDMFLQYSHKPMTEGYEYVINNDKIEHVEVLLRDIDGCDNELDLAYVLLSRIGDEATQNIVKNYVNKHLAKQYNMPELAEE